MQTLESSSIQASALQAHRNIQQHGQPELIFPRHEHPPHTTADGNKFPGLIIEDETKHYVDGVDEDSSDGEPDSKMSRGSGDRQKKTRGRVKIRMEFIHNKLRRYTTFSKRKTGIMKKVLCLLFEGRRWLLATQKFRPKNSTRFRCVCSRPTEVEVVVHNNAESWNEGLVYGESWDIVLIMSCIFSSVPSNRYEWEAKSHKAAQSLNISLHWLNDLSIVHYWAKLSGHPA